MIAMKPASSTDTRSTLNVLADLALDSWESWGLAGRAPRRLEWVISARSYVQKVVVNFVHPSTGELIVVGKIANAPSASPIIEREYQNLFEVRDRLAGDPRLRDSLPIPFDLLSISGVQALMESALPGKAGIGAKASGHDIVATAHFDDCLNWLVDFHERSGAAATGLQHGDFTFGNMLVNPEGKLSVLDWENAGHFSPCYDLFSLASSAAFQVWEAAGQRGRLDEAFNYAYASRNRLSERIAMALSSYCERLGLNQAKAGDWLLDFFQTKGERMAAMYGPRNTYARAWESLGQQAMTATPTFLGREW